MAWRRGQALGQDLRDRVLSDAGRPARAAEQDREDVAEARREWAAARPGMDPARLVFLDETWATTNMARRYGRGPRGQRVLDAVPHGRWRTTTVVAALRAGGVTAPLVLEGARTAAASWPTCASSSRRRCGPATSWSWTT
jgi:hypothetical protein